MQVAGEVKKYCESCERLIMLMSINRALTEDEARVVDFYSKELQAKVAFRPPKP